MCEIIFTWLKTHESIAIWAEGIALVAIFILDWKERRDQRKDRKEQHKETLAQLEVSQKQADALVSSERAWVMVDLEKQSEARFITDGTSGDGSYDTGAFIRCICSNQGKTPAKIIEKRICLFVTSITRPLPKEPNFDIEIVDAEPHYLRSGQQSTHDWTIAGKGQRAIGNMTVIYGVVKYRHIFSNDEVQSTFGYRVSVNDSLERLTICPEYNKNT